MTSEGKRTLIRLGAVAAFIIVLIWLMRALQSVTTVVMVAFFLAYILNPFVERLTAWGLGRPLAVSIILLSGLSLFVGLVLFVVPVVIQEITRFADVLPRYAWALHDQLMRLAEEFGVSIPQDWDQVTTLLIERGRKFLPRIADISVRAFFSIFESTLRILSTLLHILLVPIITYYLMVSFHHIKHGIRDLIPPVRKGSGGSKARGDRPSALGLRPRPGDHLPYPGSSVQFGIRFNTHRSGRSPGTRFRSPLYYSLSWNHDRPGLRFSHGVGQVWGPGPCALRPGMDRTRATLGGLCPDAQDSRARYGSASGCLHSGCDCRREPLWFCGHACGRSSDRRTVRYYSQLPSLRIEIPTCTVSPRTRDPTDEKQCLVCGVNSHREFGGHQLSRVGCAS